MSCLYNHYTPNSGTVCKYTDAYLAPLDRNRSIVPCLNLVHMLNITRCSYAYRVRQPFRSEGFHYWNVRWVIHDKIIGNAKNRQPPQKKNFGCLRRRKMIKSNILGELNNTVWIKSDAKSYITRHNYYYLSGWKPI